MIIGHQKQWQFLKRLAESDKIPHALLFVGQEKLGKKTLALEFLKLSFGADILHHPDFNLVEPAENEIQISQIRNLNWRLSLKPFSAPFKAAIIDKAHLMNQEAQNCFLKTLEEPRGKTVLILISDYPELLYKTILSRCEAVKFYPVSQKEIKAYLESEKITKEKVEEIAEASLGKPGLAVDFISCSQTLENKKKIVNELIKISESPFAVRFQYAKELVEKENLKDVLPVWLFYFRNILLSRLNSEEKNSSPSKYSFSKIKNIIQKIQSTILLTSTTNVNQRLALEILMLEF